MKTGLIGDLDSLPEEDRARMTFMTEQLQVRDSMRLYNTLVQRCFSDCVDSFMRKTLGKQEEMCVRHCTEKFLRHSILASRRFAEHSEGADTSD